MRRHASLLAILSALPLSACAVGVEAGPFKKKVETPGANSES